MPWSQPTSRHCWRRRRASRRIAPILGCTHFPLVEHLFRRHLPAFTRLLSQPEVVADSLEDYLNRHPRYCGEPGAMPGAPVLLTTGEPAQVNRVARIFWPDAPAFQHLSV